MNGHSETTDLQKNRRWIEILDIGKLNLAAVLVCVGIWTYKNSLDAPGVFDDGVEIYRSLEAERGVTRWIPRPREYVRMSVRLNHAIGGEKVRGYRQLNRLVHITNALLLFGLVRLTLHHTVFKGRFNEFAVNSFAFCVALLWLVHPMQTQAVSYMAQRLESMMTTCFFGSLYCLARAGHGRRTRMWYAGCLLLFVVGVGTKEVIAMLPFVLLLYDRAFLSASWKDVIRSRWALYSFMLLPMFLFAFWIAPFFSGRSAGVGLGHPWLTQWMYARTQPAVIFHYLRLAAWPDKLCLDYCWPVMSVRESLPWIGLMAVTLSVSVWTWFRNPGIGFLPLSFFLILVPTSSFMPINDLAMEHRMYLPLAFVLCLFMAGLFAAMHRLTSAHKRLGDLSVTGSLAVTVALSVPLIVRTMERNEDYENPQQLWQTVVDARPESHRAHFNLAATLSESGYREEAVRHTKLAFRYICKNWPHPGEVTNYFHDTKRMLTADDCADEFIPLVEEVRKMYPGDGTILLNLADEYYEQKDFQKAIAVFREAQSFPEVADRAGLFLAASEMASGNPEASVKRLYEQIIERPLRQDSINYLAWILAAHPIAEVRNGDLAVRLGERVCVDMKAEDALSWGTLASAYAEAGDFEKAVSASNRAIEICLANPAAGNVVVNRSQLALYMMGQPCRMNDMESGMEAAAGGASTAATGGRPGL